MSVASDFRDPSLEKLTPAPSQEERTIEDLARRRIAEEDEQLKRNLDELERLADGDPG
jgi:hypothetical protein